MWISRKMDRTSLVVARLLQLEQQLVELAEPNFGFLREQPAYLVGTHPSHQSTPTVASSLRNAWPPMRSGASSAAGSRSAKTRWST